MGIGSARRVCAAVAAAGCGLATAGCADTSSPAQGSRAGVAVVSSTDVWGDIAATVGGAHARVTSLISSPSQDPHSYPASARDELAVSKADVVIENGGGYDDFMDQLARAGDHDPVILDAVDVSGLDQGEADLNEHVWYDLQAAEKVAARMAGAFGDADPAHASAYRRNARAFDASLSPLIAREKRLRQRLGGARVAVTEPVPLYMLDAIGAVDETPRPFSAAVEEGADVSVSTLDDTVSLLTDHRVSALVYNEQTSDPFTERLTAAAAGAGIPVVAVTETLPDHTDYATWMADNLDHLDTALSRP